MAQLLLSAALSAGWLLLGVRWLAPDLTLAELALFVLLLRSVAQPVMAMGHGGDALRAATLAAGRIRALLAHPEIRWGGRSTIASAPQGAALRLSDLGCRQDERWLLQGVNLAVEPGEWLAIVGASGSGKSTLLRLIARYSEPDSGTVSLDGVLADAFSAQAFNQMVAVVPQENTPPAMSLRDNLTLLVDGAEAAQLRRALAELGLAERLQDRLDDTPSLSGGEAQRLSIARALLARRPLLLADEPTSAQDRQNRECILTALAQLPATRLVATHDAELCRRADRVAVLAEGRLMAVGTPAELADHPALLAVLAEHQEADDEV
ncbi:TPA: ATP-binding cassette domain-containing protein [Klebsiella pneumoniae]